jgi:acetolactate synthase small subunit
MGAVSVPTACFSVLAESDPGVMPRLMELFAKRGLVPTRWASQQGPRGLAIDIQMVGMDRDLGAYVGRCMRQVHGVETVLTTEAATVTQAAASAG